MPRSGVIVASRMRLIDRHRTLQNISVARDAERAGGEIRAGDQSQDRGGPWTPPAMSCGRCARDRANPSLWLDASRSNDFAPLRALLGDEGSKLGRRIPLRHDAKGLETLGGFRPFKIRS